MRVRNSFRVKPLRILQVGMSPYYGGTESFVMNQYRKINREKIQFDFLNVFSEPIACEDEIRDLGGCIYHLNMSRRKGMKQYHKNLDTFFSECGDKFDIIHCNFQSLINIDLLKYAKKYNIRGRIAHAHNAGYGKEPNLMQRIIITYNKKRISKYATTYFACSSLAGEWMFGRESSTIIKNAINTTEFLYDKEIRNKMRLQYGLNDEKLIVFVGRLDPQKNPIFLIEIFNEIIKKEQNWRLFIIGDGILRADIEARIEQTKLQNSVRLLGSRNDVKKFLQAADCFLLPSKFEGLGIVLIEAQAAGLKCFTSMGVVPNEVDITGLVEFISLEDSALVWANNIIRAEKNKRINQFDAIRQAGYDSDSSIQFIENEYLSLK